MRVDNLEPLIDIPFDMVTCDLNGLEFVLHRDGLSAVFDPDGKQLTEFVEGTFYWRWSGDVLGYGRVICNDEAGIKITV